MEENKSEMYLKHSKKMDISVLLIRMKWIIYVANVRMCRFSGTPLQWKQSKRATRMPIKEIA